MTSDTVMSLNIDLTLELIDLLNLNILFRMSDLIEVTQSVHKDERGFYLQKHFMVSRYTR